jgi:hypothetical protein
MAGVGAVVIVVLIVTVVRTEGLAESNKTRLSEQAEGVKVGLDILCKLKKYDLTTGLPALKARRERGAEYDPQRAVVLERALLLVLSIPSSETCLAIPEPTIPKSKRGPSPEKLLHELEQGGSIPTQTAPQSQPPNATPRIEREATPHTGSTAPPARGPRGSRGPAGQPGKTPVATAPAPTSSTPTTASVTPRAATVSTTPPLVEPPTTTTSTTPTTPAPAPEPPKRRPLLCVEALGLKVLC